MTHQSAGNPFGFQMVGLGQLVDDHPLCPWKWKLTDDELYVSVDSTEDEFKRFVGVFADPLVPADRGHLITVVGASGYGKTSLTHRCAAWLEGVGLPAKGKAGEIVDLHREDIGPVLEERFRRIYRLLVLKLGAPANLANHKAELNEYAEDPLLGYSRLSELLSDRFVAIVLLPPTKVTGELPKYYNLAQNRENLIFFAESGTAEVGQECRSVIPENAGHTSLSLGPLKDGDAWEFAQARVNRFNPPQVTLSFSKKELNDMLRDARSLKAVRALQVLFFHLYREALRDGRKAITEDDVRRFYMRHSTLNLNDLNR